jgi:hypothetical protein
VECKSCQSDAINHRHLLLFLTSCCEGNEAVYTTLLIMNTCKVLSWTYSYSQWTSLQHKVVLVVWLGSCLVIYGQGKKESKKQKGKVEVVSATFFTRAWSVAFLCESFPLAICYSKSGSTSLTVWFTCVSETCKGILLNQPCSYLCVYAIVTTIWCFCN